MANKSFNQRVPIFKWVFLFAIIISIPLTLWSVNNVSTETRSHASSATYFACSDGDYIACLKNQFNAKLAGTSSQSKAKIIYDALNIPMSYVNFHNLFRSLGITITVSSSAQSSGGAWAITGTSGNITLYGNIFTARQLVQQQYIIHEAAHTISRTTDGISLQASLYSNIYKKGLDHSCFKSGPLIKTFPFSTAGNYVHEVFAESVADTLVCPSGTSCGGWGSGSVIINSFPSTCASTYSFVKNNILGPMYSSSRNNPL